MDITDEQKKSSKIPSQSCIPQMVITSADDTSAESSNITECTLVLIPTAANGSTPIDEDMEGSEQISAGESAINSECTSKYADQVSHSVRQRPLVIELDKNVVSEESVARPATPPTPPPPVITVKPSPPPLPVATSTPTAMQRPLVFEGSAKSDVPVPFESEENSVNMPTAVQDELNHDAPISVHPLPDSYLDDSVSTRKVSALTKKEDGVKKFFDSLWHADTEDSSIPKPDELLSQSESTTSPGSPKSEKSSIKKFFQSPKSELSKSKSEPASPPEYSSDSKETSFTKDTKQSIKSFFGSKKYETGSQTDKDGTQIQISADQDGGQNNASAVSISIPKQDILTGGNDLAISEPSQLVDKPIENKASSSFTKDTKQTIKSFFSTKKQETLEHTDVTQVKSGLVHSTTEAAVEKTTHSLTPDSPTEVKDSAIKTFFDSFKHESSDQKHKSGLLLKSEPQPETNISLPKSPDVLKEHENKKESTSFAKDTKQNIKAFFDTFKHDSSDQKLKDSACKISASQPNVCKEIDSLHQESLSQSKDFSPSFAKEARHNLKSILSPFKSEPNVSKHKDVEKKPLAVQPSITVESEQVSDHEGLKAKSSEEVKPHSSFAKDTRDNIKAFFDNLKHEHTQKEVSQKLPATSEPVIHQETTGAHKNSHKHPLKRLFSSKGNVDVTASSPSNLDGQLDKEFERKQPLKGSKSVKLDLVPTYSVDNFEKTSSFSHINGYDSDIVSEPKERAQSVPSEIFRKNKDFCVFSPELQNTENSYDPVLDAAPDQQKDGFHGIKKFFGSFRHEKSDKSVSNVMDSKGEHSKAQTVDDSVLHSAETKCEKEKKNKGIKRSLSDKVSREEVVQNFKGFFDSISHRTPSSKKSVKDSEHIYDTVEVRPEITNPVIQISSESPEIKSTALPNENHGMKKISSSFQAKDSLKSISDANKSVSDKVKENVKKDETSKPRKTESTVSCTTEKEVIMSDPIQEKTNEPTPSKLDKTSMFNSIGENIMALKDKMMHTKEKKKSNLIEDNVTVDSVSKESCHEPSSVPISKDKPCKPVKPPIPEKPAQTKAMPKAPTPQSAGKAKTYDNSNTSPGSPTSLYDTCCMRVASLLRDKAIHIVSECTKSPPPPKPPKPSAEAIARARAVAVSKRLVDVQKGHSIGESFPVGCDNLRFVDDDTESSCDYKDVENFDYIMDYGLINRYKLENNFDTFSVPSTCSGLTSYYTADNVTLNESFSDAILESVSLSSDLPYNYRNLSSSKSDLKIASTGKKVPPPIPPKPAISKIKAAPNENTVSPCVNGLSLSPRLQTKFSKDPAETLKRPLMVADIKGTQFSSLQHSKTKDTPKKPLRSFNTILKNESLRNISGVSSVDVEKTLFTEQDSSQGSNAFQITLKRDDSSPATVEKRTKSPPRPPPPNLDKKPTPHRPPPPVPTSRKKTQSIKLECNAIPNKTSEIKDSGTGVESNLVVEQPIIEIEDNTSSRKLPFPDKNEMNVINVFDNETILHGTLVQQKETVSSSEFEINWDKDKLNNNIETDNVTADSLNNNIEVSQMIPTENPKPPPRCRRIRSRTVEVVPKKRDEERLKRSQSLSDVDVEKRVTFLEAQKSEIDSKSLYSAINKNGKKLNSKKTTQSSPDLVSGRPLPAPPPPPRKFRSLERKSTKDSEKNEDKTGARSRVASESPVKPPSRRRKSEKERFMSLHSENKKGSDTPSPHDNLKRASSAPSKPDRRKDIRNEKYDVNANISCLEDDFLGQNIPVDCTDSLTEIDLKSKSPQSTDERKRSNSSWYDNSEMLGESWELLDVSHTPNFEEEFKYSPKVPLRKKTDSKRKMRETSKFYVNMGEEETVRSLVDKETSPLPLDCSEKSVQTSLETLSQDIISRDEQMSRDEQSEDTDELLDLAQTLQKELSTIINRHKVVNDSSEETPSPPLSAATSEKNIPECLKKPLKTGSVRSSTSEVWPLTSSDDSDGERAEEDSSNLNELAVKRKQKKIFYIAQEIMTSEEIFVDALRLLNVDFKAAVEAASQQRNLPILPDEALSQILNHLPQLLHLNENLLMELRDRIQNWDKTEKIADIIVKMGPFLKLYSWYIHDFESNVSLLEECKKKYTAFAQTVKEFEMSPRCKRLALNHYMLKPIQRIPQYRLLLQEYLHHLREDAKDYQDTIAALQIVSEVANHANDSMKHGDNAQKLISIQNSIMGHKEIVKPGRVFVKEGELMKLSRKGMQPRWFILFNDLLLYLTPVQQGLYRINHELLLTGMKVAIPIQQDYQNEFSIISVTRSFTLASRSPEERQEWIVALTKAIEENASKRSTFTNTRLHQKAQDKTSSEDEGAFVLGRKAPVWIPDARVTMCQLCTSEFTVTFRRHHCRACGKVVCSICSSHRISLPYLGNRIARVCDECHTHLGQGSSACTESGETDSENQQIAVKSHLRTDNRHQKKNKRSLPSVLKEVCANDQGSTISGYLHKKTGKSWKRDWFVVKDKVLYEYKASEDVAALRSVPLLGYQIESFNEPHENVDASLLFQLTHPGQAPILFYADTVGSTERWMSALKTATVLE